MNIGDKVKVRDGQREYTLLGQPRLTKPECAKPKLFGQIGELVSNPEPKQRSVQHGINKETVTFKQPRNWLARFGTRVYGFRPSDLVAV